MADSTPTSVSPRGGQAENDSLGSLYGDELAPGALAGEYVVLGTIAFGGCGTVYAVEHRVLGRRAALKVLRHDLAGSPEIQARFVREARAANLIRHPNIIDIYEFGQLPDGRPYYVMEFLDGWDLANVIHQRGTLTLGEALELLHPVCDALSAAHAAGVIHRDLKASNIFVARQDLPWRVKLLDFGVAKLIHPEPGLSSATSVGHRLGTPYAMAPEQIRGEAVDARTDVYALGVLIFEMLTGRHPFEAEETREIERLHLEAPPPAPSQFAPVGAAVDAVVARCMEKEPARRYESVNACRAALQEVVESHSPLRAGGEVSTAQGIGIHVEVRIDDSGLDVMDDSLLDDMGGVLDLVDQHLRSSEFQVLLQTGSAILGARVLSEPVEPERRERERALGDAISLHQALDRRAKPDPRVHVVICVHVDKVLARTSHPPEIVGGALSRIAAWAPPQQEIADGLCATPKAVEGLSTFATAHRSGRYVLISTEPSSPDGR